MSYSRLLLSISTVVVMASYPAQAGFKWDDSSSSNVELMEKQPVDEIITEELLPVHPGSVELVHTPKVQKEMHVLDEIEGFGRDVPLSYAVASIVPKSYAYSFGAGVDTSKPITWRGGKPWNIVLEDSFTSSDLALEIDQNKVTIYKVQPKKINNTIKSISITKPVSYHSDNMKYIGREVFIRRNSGDVVEVSKKKIKEFEHPVNLIETKRIEVEELSESPAESEVIEQTKFIEKIDPDIPVSVSSYQGNGKNIFEMVVSSEKPVKVLDTNKVSTYHAKSGQTVRGVIEKWSEEANVQVYWETKYDFPVEKSMALTATYPMAVQALLGRYENIDPRPTVKLHPNWPHGPSIITVK